MNSFPLISELPSVLVADGWRWEPCSFRSECVLGIDHESRSWLVQMRGSVKAYQEHVFASLAQRLGISCQSSVYLQIPACNRPKMDDTPTDEACQLAIWLMKEHSAGSCGDTCPIGRGREWDFTTDETLNEFLQSGLKNAADFVLGDILGSLCGGDENVEGFWTVNHEYVAIDSERMFEWDSYVQRCSWMDLTKGKQLALDLFDRVCAISDEELCTIAELPPGYLVNPVVQLGQRLIEIKAIAGNYLRVFRD